ncbi:IS701 family transposase, partial [Haloferax sp. Atlit-19N]
ETFFKDSKQDLLGDCEIQTDEGVSRHWHLFMAAYSLVRLDPDSSALGTVCSKASSLRANLEHSLKEAVYNLLSWVRDNDDRGIGDLMEEIDYLFVHSTADANVQS